MVRIPRESYISWLNEFKEKKVIKVLTGLRRSGKSTILEMFVDDLRTKGIDDNQIVSINFERLENEPLLDPQALHALILSRMKAGKTLFVLLDEVQHVADYEKVLDSLYARDGIDLYVTGSTADLLSSEIASRLTGRYVEINILPLSFRESVFGKDVTDGNARRLFMDYLTYGGLPGALEYPNGSHSQREYIEGVFKTIIEKDVLKRSGKGRFLVERIVRYLTDTVGSLTSPKRITDRLGDENHTRGEKSAAYNTVVSYLERLVDCFFVYKAPRYNVCGGANLKQVNKYYLTDFGFKYHILNNPTLEVQQLLENVVYFEFLHRRYKVATGKVEDKEVDFMIQGFDGRIKYVQVAVTVSDPDKLKQELEAFKGIRDNYPKYILTLDEIFTPDHDGIRTLNVIDYLLGKQDFD